MVCTCIVCLLRLPHHYGMYMYRVFIEATSSVVLNLGHRSIRNSEVKVTGKVND